MITILIIVLIVLAIGGAWGYPRFGYGGLSPFAILLIILLVLLLTGNL